MIVVSRSVFVVMQVLLADRSLMPGDVVVRKENGREKMCGYCRQVGLDFHFICFSMRLSYFLLSYAGLIGAFYLVFS